MNWFFRLWWLSLFAKLVLGCWLPLASDEAYYWIWSHRLQWSYFDHPPAIAAILWMGHIFEGFGSAVRIPGIILGHLTLLVWYRILSPRMSPDSLTLWLVLVLFSPLIGLGSILMTPDLPLLFFWSLGLFFFERCLTAPSLRNYSLFGLVLGLGFSSKYHMVLLVPILLIVLTIERNWKKVRWAHLPFTFAFGLVGSFPVLFWNWSNDWQSIRFQLHHGFGRSYWHWEWTLTYLIGQILLLGPLLLPAFLRSFKSQGQNLFKVNSLFGWGFFLVSSFKSVVEANWPIVSFHPAYACLVKGKVSKKAVAGTLALTISLGAMALAHWVKPFPFLPRFDSQEYRHLAPLVDRYQPLFANTYQMASVLSFETKKEVLKLNDMSRFDFFDQIPESKPKSGTFYLIKRKDQNLPSWLPAIEKTRQVVERIDPDFEVLKIEIE